MSALSDRIREEREWLGAPVGVIAARVGVSVADVEAWECGTVEPTEDEVARLAQVLGLPGARLHGAPLAMDRDLSYVCGGIDLTHEDRYEVARFFEYLRHTNRAEVPR